MEDVNKTIIEFKKVQDLVEQLLEIDERCRNDDKWLCYRVIGHFTRVYIPFEDFDKFPSFETITRCRRKIQNKLCKFPPTEEEVLFKRRTREAHVKHWSKL